MKRHNTAMAIKRIPIHSKVNNAHIPLHINMIPKNIKLGGNFSVL
jgi:hypothetical protein